MKKLKLFYEPASEQFFVLLLDQGKEMLFKVDQINPVMISRVIEHAFFTNHHERGKLVEEMEEFAKKEIEKLQDGF